MPTSWHKRKRKRTYMRLQMECDAFMAAARALRQQMQYVKRALQGDGTLVEDAEAEMLWEVADHPRGQKA